MLYFIAVFLVVSFMLLYKEPKSKSAWLIVLTVGLYAATLFAMLLYLSKDTYYYNTINQLFSIPTLVWKKMMFLSISKSNAIRLMNFFSLAVIFSGVCFSLSYKVFVNERNKKVITGIALGLLAVECVIYDPKVIESVYLYVYPDKMTSSQIVFAEGAIHNITVTINFMIIGFSIVMLLGVLKKASPFQFIKVNIMGVGGCYMLIMISYVILLGQYPKCLIKVSKVGSVVSYLSAPLTVSNMVTKVFPYYLLISFLFICYWSFRTGKTTASLENNSFSISKQISASETTSKAFCHYLKNEILAIQSEAEILDVDETQQETVQELVKRCDNLYNRLDALHKSTKASELVLNEVDLRKWMNDVIAHFSYEIKEYKIIFECSDAAVMALIDESYFTQAIHNIITNAFDAMKDVPKERKVLNIIIEKLDNWTIIQIRDHGKGISKENITKIFVPFYSTEPIVKHWGVGLSLTYKIIKAHEGHIEVESEIGEGTTMKIMLPRI